MSRDISFVIIICMLVGTLALIGGFVLGYNVGRTDGQYAQRCVNLGGRILNDGTCGNETITHIDAGAR